MTDPTTTNTTAQTVNTIVARANSSAVQILQGLITADVPWLGWPVIKQIFSFFLSWLDGYISIAEQKGATTVVITAQTDAEETNFNVALAALKAAQATGDANAITAAQNNYTAAALALANSDGSSSPNT